MEVRNKARQRLNGSNGRGMANGNGYLDPMAASTAFNGTEHANGNGYTAPAKASALNNGNGASNGKAAGKSRPTPRSSPLISWLTFTSDVVLSLIFFTKVFEQWPTIWYIPMNYMGFSGTYELLLMALLLPAVLGIASVRRVLTARPSLNLLALVGLPSYFAPTLQSSLVVLSFGVGFSAVLQFNALYSDDRRRERTVWSMLLALVVLLGVRMGFASVNPIFAYTYVNLATLGIGVAACLVKLLEPTQETLRPPKQPTTPLFKHLHELRFGVGFGTLIFATHWLLTEHGTLPRFVDVHPFPYGCGTIASVIAGILLSRSRVVRSDWWWALALLSGAAVFQFQSPVAIWPGYILVAYFASMWHVMSEDLVKFTSPFPTVAYVVLTWVFVSLAFLWAVAFPFVPGGDYLRESSYPLYFGVMALIRLGYTRLGDPAVSLVATTSSSLPLLRKQAMVLLTIIVLVVVCPAIYHRAQHYRNYDANGVDKSTARGMIWAIHFAYDNFGRPSNEDILNQILETGANIIGLVETDTNRQFNGNRDVMEWLEHRLHMYSDYGPGTLNHTWGCGLLSAFPIVNVTHENLPSPQGEVACLIDATLDVNGAYVDVIVVHFGNTHHSLDRDLQAEDSFHRAQVKGSRPTIWLGYFTHSSDQPNYQKMLGSGWVDTAPTETDRYCLYIFYKNLELLEFKHRSVGNVSDTEIQTATYKIPPTHH